jgi:hypothetical protein
MLNTESDELPTAEPPIQTEHSKPCLPVAENAAVVAHGQYMVNGNVIATMLQPAGPDAAQGCFATAVCDRWHTPNSNSQKQTVA